ncbi:MAG TPA: type II restriction endonuclease [Thermoanaerobaculia bacterium]|nr:type II restriction endonuclease [Thermoanaerobaculia bacterium]
MHDLSPGTSGDLPQCSSRSLAACCSDRRKLEEELETRGHLSPLPKEPAALANVIEVAVVDYLIKAAAERQVAIARRGTERGYPDIEIESEGEFHAVDVKVARRARNGLATQSRITLYTGNTYFAYPDLCWPGMFRAYGDYASHLTLILLYTFDESLRSRFRDVEIVVQESWRIGSRKRSSTTREYIGAVQNIEALRSGAGDFATEQEFYKYWRGFKFKVGEAVSKQLKKILRTRKAED